MRKLDRKHRVLSQNSDNDDTFEVEAAADEE
jgi:hypothetical protein